MGAHSSEEQQLYYNSYISQQSSLTFQLMLLLRYKSNAPWKIRSVSPWWFNLIKIKNPHMLKKWQLKLHNLTHPSKSKGTFFFSQSAIFSTVVGFGTSLSKTSDKTKVISSGLISPSSKEMRLGKRATSMFKI